MILGGAYSQFQSQASWAILVPTISKETNKFSTLRSFLLVIIVASYIVRLFTQQILEVGSQLSTLGVFPNLNK